MRRRDILAGAMASTLAACSAQRSGREPAPELRVAVQKGGARALFAASGLLAGAPYHVAWSEFGAASPLLEALSDGAVDLGGVGDAPFVFAFAAGAPIRAVQAYRSGGVPGSSVAVLTARGSSIREVAGLRGRSVATTRGSVGHYLLIRLIDRAGLPASSVRTVFLDPAAARAALTSGSVDAWATWAPYVGFGVLHDGDRVLADGRGLMSGIGFTVANQGSLASKLALIDDFLARQARAYEWARAHPQELAAAISRDTGLPDDVARDMVARGRAQVIPIDQALVAEERMTFDAFRRAGVIERQIDVADAFAPDRTRSA
ncbi:MAG: ABC transporter substrate-binding protein [Caulobacteraceae bacterium]|nr:ABC transporter substrate-binding protein [Caulobacteraceae bacterium]